VNNSDVFLCGHIRIAGTAAQGNYLFQRLQTTPLQGWECQPIKISGAQAMSGDQVFQSIFQNQRIFNNFNPESILTMFRAEVEDWLLVCASTKPEDRPVSRNTLRFQAVSALDLIATVYSKAALYRSSAKYERNALRIDFSRSDDSDGSSGYEQLVGLFGRDIHETILPRLGGDVLIIGPPMFKCMFLPRLEAVMTVQYSELRGPGGEIVKWSNKGTTESIREFKRNIFSTKHCMQCLRRIAANPASGEPDAPAFAPVHGCTCAEPPSDEDPPAPSPNTMDDGSDSDPPSD
jgi:hypothetical protein